ncbi:unnamed protein product [Arabidopsis arenosa]|uniref:CHHC U11-48K-type domain-containing protein n=1 Tax=Arabidopsis arenosa TaxID=38785 RepID=A0A8S2A155_ARAAE|nr:unnamed protein product [Arabidopsis arenosa]
MAVLVRCPFDSNHFMSPEALFLHSLGCPNPLDLTQLNNVEAINQKAQFDGGCFVVLDIGCGVFVGGIDDEDKRASAAMSSSTLLLPSKAISKPKLSQGSRDYTLKHVKKQQSLSHSPKTKTSGFTVATGQGSPSDSPGTNRWFKPEIDAPSPIRSIQIEEKAMKDLRRFYSSVKTRGSSTKPLSSYLLLLAVGVTNFAVNGTSEKDWDLVKEMGETYPSVVPCIGLHPCDTDEIGAETENFLVDAIESSDSPLLGNETAGDEKYFGKRRKIASWSIARVCIGVLGLASAASPERLPMLFIILTTWAITALCVSLLGSLLAQPRTQIPVKSTIAIGVLAAALAFFMDVVQLSEMVFPVQLETVLLEGAYMLLYARLELRLGRRNLEWPYEASFFGDLDKLPVFLARQTSIPGVGIVVEPCAALLIMIVTILLCFGIKKSSLVQAIVTSVNVCKLVFIIVVGGYLACKTGWVGYEFPSGSYCWISPILFIESLYSFLLYIWRQWDAINSPRIFMTMARDGLLPAFFSEISPRTQVPVKSTIAIGVLAAALAFFMDVAQLSEMVSVGTLMAFTVFAACVLVLRYVPPDGVSLSSHWSLLESVMVLPNSYNDHGAALGEKEPLGGHMRDAATVMLSGQVADGFATIFIGELIDRFGHFKIWHAAGSILLAISFSSAIFNVGWAATQVSHMAIVNCITLNSTSRVALANKLLIVGLFIHPSPLAAVLWSYVLWGQRNQGTSPKVDVNIKQYFYFSVTRYGLGLVPALCSLVGVVETYFMELNSTILKPRCQSLLLE